MSGLGALLAQPERLFARLRQQAPELRTLRKAVESITADGQGDPDFDGTAAVQQRVMQAAIDGRLGQLGRRDLREGCKTFFHPPTPPGRAAKVASALIDEVERRKRRAAFLALINAYIDGFDAGDEDARRLAERLESSRTPWPWRAHDPWPSRAERFGLFLPDEAPERISKAVLGSPEPASTVLSQAGLDTDGRRRGGLALAAFRAACGDVEAMTGDRALRGQLRLIDWVCPRLKGRELELPEAWPEFAGALFAPWAAAPPDKEHQTLISDLAIDYAGDPRSSPPRWRKVEDLRPDALAILKRWLVRASVLQFFDVVDSVADERMWRYRRAFWKAYVEAEYVDDAWIVFGSAGAAHARTVAERTGEPALRRFGRLESGGGRGPNHACLLMTIGDLTIAEWSHNGRCYIWGPGASKPPKLGRDHYYPDELAHPLDALDGHQRIGIAHMHAESFGWQARVATHILEETGLKTARRDWRP